MKNLLSLPVKTVKKIILVLTTIIIIPVLASNNTVKNEEKTFDSFLKEINFEGWKEWKNHLGKLESKNNWKCINPYGYMGKYQFGDIALTAVKSAGINLSNFRKNPYSFNTQMQEEALLRLTYLNYLSLRPYINRYKNKIINGVKITESGILGSCHLLGASTIITWLKCYGTIHSADANGTTVERYMKEFSHINVNWGKLFLYEDKTNWETLNKKHYGKRIDARNNSYLNRAWIKYKSYTKRVRIERSI